MNFMAVSASSLGLTWHFNPKRGGTKAQQTVIWAMKLADLICKKSQEEVRSEAEGGEHSEEACAPTCPE